MPADVLDAVRAPGEKPRDLTEIYRSFRSQELVHSGVMKAVGSVHTTSDAIWVSVAVDGPAAPEHRFHPALIDGSAVAASASPWAASAALPAAALRLVPGRRRRWAAPFRHTRVRRAGITRGDELLTFGMEFFDEHGRKLCELTGLTTKAVNDAGHIDPARSTTSEPAPVDAPVGRTVPRPRRRTTRCRRSVRSVVAGRLGVPEDRIDEGANYYALGLDSATLLRIAAELGSGWARSSRRRCCSSTPPCRRSPGIWPHGRSRRPSRAVTPAGANDVPEYAETPRTLPRPRPPRTPPVRTSRSSASAAGTRRRAASPSSGRTSSPGATASAKCSEDRWPGDTFAGERTPSGRPVSRLGGFLDDPDCFDAEFFGIPDAEAAQLDPQERLFLEVCWEAVEDAGYTPAGLSRAGDGAEDGGRRGAVGVFVGVMHKDYVLVQHDAADGAPAAPLALNAAAIANRVSHVCDFHGPSLAIDAVCASSLSAVHLAVESLRRGECDAALAGGVNLSLHPAKYRTYGSLDLLAGETPARSFGAGGDGYVAAEGVGAVLLKPLGRALADGDAVYAVVKGTAVNHSGRTPGIRVPSVAAQAELIETCLERAGVDPGTIGYLEAHGTGTEIGDLIEVQGLRRAFEKHTDAKGYCALGSGQVRHRPCRGGRRDQRAHQGGPPAPPPHPDAAGRRRRDQPVPRPRRLAVPAPDGARGVDGGRGRPRHAAPRRSERVRRHGHQRPRRRREAPPVLDHALRGDAAGPVLVPLSATDGHRLRAYADRLLRFLDTTEGAALAPAALAHTLQTGRVALAERAVILAHDLDEVREGLEAVARGTDADGTGVRVWRGRVADTAAEARLLDEDDVRAELIGRWAARGKWGKVAELWLDGYAVAWPAPTARRPARLRAPAHVSVRQAAPLGRDPRTHHNRTGPDDRPHRHGPCPPRPVASTGTSSRTARRRPPPPTGPTCPHRRRPAAICASSSPPAWDAPHGT
ncbi:phosphopantetheine-binding protein [Streptomyces thinghirensis]|nr:phosphopantetheine-binding protein [Streptomyces thinghirensis]